MSHIARGRKNILEENDSFLFRNYIFELSWSYRLNFYEFDDSLNLSIFQSRDLKLVRSSTFISDPTLSEITNESKFQKLVFEMKLKLL